MAPGTESREYTSRLNTEDAQKRYIARLDLWQPNMSLVNWEWGQTQTCSAAHVGLLSMSDLVWAIISGEIPVSKPPLPKNPGELLSTGEVILGRLGLLVPDSQRKAPYCYPIELENSVRLSKMSLCKSLPQPALSRGRIIIHVVRHAESQHNVVAPNWQRSWERLYNNDPLLTGFGKSQALKLQKGFLPMKSITHILCSPMKRTLGTCLLGFKPLIDEGLSVIAWPDLKERGSQRSCLGTPYQELEKILIAFQVDLTMCRTAVDGNTDNPYRWELYHKENTETRPERVRKGLWELGNLALQAQSGEDVQGSLGHWKQFAYTPKQNENGNIEILVVTHGALIRHLEDSVQKDQFYNTMYKSFEFPTEEEIKGGMSSWKLIETQESKDMHKRATMLF